MEYLTRMNNPATTQQKPNKIIWFIICVLILGAGVASFILLKNLKPVPEQRTQTLQIPAVETLLLEYRHSPLMIEGSGIVSPKAEISLSSQVNGEVIAMHENLVTGGSFTKGEIVIQIDPRSFEAALAEAVASKNASISSLDFLTKRIERLESLREQGYAPEENLDDAVNQRDQALANIARQDATIQNRELDLERASIIAPFDGQLLSESVDVGDIVSPGRELAEFYASDEFEIIVSLNADDASFIPNLWSKENSSESKAWISVKHGNLSYEWEGYLDRVESDIDRTTRTIDIVVRIPEPSTKGQLIDNGSTSSVLKEAPPLMIGMYGTVAIEGMSLAQHFVLPLASLRNGNSIWIADSENKLRIEPVEMVREEGDNVVLLAPQLREGSKIIVSDIALVSDGMSIQVKSSSVSSSLGASK